MVAVASEYGLPINAAVLVVEKVDAVLNKSFSSDHCLTRYSEVSGIPLNRPPLFPKASATSNTRQALIRSDKKIRKFCNRMAGASGETSGSQKSRHGLKA